jgi:hypothetical protein
VIITEKPSLRALNLVHECYKCTHGDVPTTFMCPYTAYADKNSVIRTYLYQESGTNAPPAPVNIRILCFSGVHD